MMVRLIERYRFLVLFIILLCFFVIKAVDSEFNITELADYFLLSLMAFSLLVIGKKKKSFFLVLISIPAIVELFLIYMSLYTSPEGVIAFKYGVASVYTLTMAVFCLYYTFKDKHIDITTLFGSLSAYLFIGLTFAYLYLALASLNPNAFTGLAPNNENQAFYFSFIAMTTVGFGDIIPHGPIAQLISWLEAFTGQVYIAIILSQLVGRYIAEHLKDKR